MKHLKAMLEMLTSAYNRDDLQNIRKGRPLKTAIGKLLGTIGWGFDIIRENVLRVREWNDLDQAQGVALDRIGANYGVRRDGAEDDFYRLMIQVKMIALLSGGDINTVIHAASSLFDIDPDKIELRELFPAKVWIVINQTDVDDRHARLVHLIARLMKRIVAAGIGIWIFFRGYTYIETPIFFGAALFERTFERYEVRREDICLGAFLFERSHETIRSEIEGGNG